MAVTLVGEIVNSCDATTGFNAGNISGDDDFVEGTGALGIKASATTQELYTTSLGATAPYDFSSGGGEEGYHIIMWFNTKTPIDIKANGGLAIIVGNGTDRGKWYVRPAGFYKGGFITRVVDTARDFNNIAAGTWTLTGNPAQLSNVTQMGGGFVTITSIMGSFNNVQIDQITIGLGLRVDAGTTGTPNTFETVRAADEDTAFYGWLGSTQGAFLGKGKIFFGPATGTATSVFRDSAFAFIWAEEDVAQGFFEFNMRGSNTEVTWSLANISIGGTARWSLTLDPAMGSASGGLTDNSGTWISYDQITLNQYATQVGTTLISGNNVFQNAADLSLLSFQNPQPALGTAAIEIDTPANFTDSSFSKDSGDQAYGHGAEITVSGAQDWDNITATGYPTALAESNYSFNANTDVDPIADTITLGGDPWTSTLSQPVYYADMGGTTLTGLTDDGLYYARFITTNEYALFNSAADAIANTNRIPLTAGSSETHYLWDANAFLLYSAVGNLTLNLLNGSTSPSYRRTSGAGTVTVNNSVTVAVRSVARGTAVVVQSRETLGTVTAGDVLGQGFADVNGQYSFSLNYEGAFGAGLDVNVRANNPGHAVAVITAATGGTVFTDETEESTDNITDDVNILPASPAVNDAVYIGHWEAFEGAKFWITDGNGTGSTFTWEYWDGLTWSTLTVTDGTNNFENTGHGLKVSWSPPGDWATTSVTNQANTGAMYFVRARLSTVGSANQTRARSIRCDATRYLPFPAEGNAVRTITGSGLTVDAVQLEDTIGQY